MNKKWRNTNKKGKTEELKQTIDVSDVEEKHGTQKREEIEMNVGKQNATSAKK